jgi:translocator protein
MKRNTLLLLETLSYLLVLMFNFLANALPLGGKQTGQVSAEYPTLFTPAGFTFSIWGIIYFLLAVYLFRKWSLNRKGDQIPGGEWFVLSSILNISWLFAWHYGYLGISMLIMAGFLLVLIRWYSITFSSYRQKPYLWLWLPVSVYLAWICVATIANASIFLVSQGGLPQPAIWTAIMLFIASGMGVFMLLRYRDLAFVLVIFWAFFGIHQNRLGEEGVDALWVSRMVLVSGGILLAGVIYFFIQNSRSRKS